LHFLKSNALLEAISLPALQIPGYQQTKAVTLLLFPQNLTKNPVVKPIYYTSVQCTNIRYRVSSRRQLEKEGFLRDEMEVLYPWAIKTPSGAVSEQHLELGFGDSEAV
jgi:hypothetical protein